MTSGTGRRERFSRKVVRGVLAAATVAAVAVVTLLGLRWAARLPPGYGSAQSQRATQLVATRSRTELEAFRSGTLRDLAVFVPGDAVVFSAFLLAASPRARHRTAGAGLGLSPWTGVSVGLVAAATVFDVVETLRFRSVLGQLLGGVPAAALDPRTQLTAWLTRGKFISFVLAGVSFIAHRVFGGGRAPQP